MSQDIIEKAKGFIMDPAAAFRNAHSDEMGEALKYFAIILAINSVLSGLMVMVGLGASTSIPGMGVGVAGGIAVIIGNFIGGIIGLFVCGLIVHIFVALIIGGNGIGQTINAMIYGATPAMLFSWIPVIGILAALWSLVLYIIGIRELHDTTTGKAAVAVLIPVVILIVLVIIALAALVAFFTISSGTFTAA
ncbi:YIP1 family protein [Methanofollis ethanolicus]|uniref:YIP1 family protein n=1 Tax=Methanofollis ethanolicus TaxID=488124 RepID=UPI00082F1E48|nr:YIP1 family protein [Methanofollis ethanolicus]